MESSFLQGKSILFVCPKFFGYEFAVKDKLVEMGATVTLLDDRPSNGLVSKSLIRIDKRLFAHEILNYYARITEDVSEQHFDIIFLFNPEALPISFLEMCKSRWSNALYVLYMCDSIKNRKHTLDFVPFCDRVFTFDHDDATLPNFRFKPLFYLDAYSSIRQNSCSIKYDICFIGTIHSDRYAIAKEVREWCDSQGLRSFFYFFMHEQILYYFNKITGKIAPPRSEVSFTKLSTSEVLNIVASSKVILDIQSPNQTGLTIRTLETMGAGKKLITTNEKIKDYDFYHSDNIAIIDRFNPTKNLDLNFFQTELNRSSDKTIDGYSIGSWLNEVLG